MAGPTQLLGFYPLWSLRDLRRGPIIDRLRGVDSSMQLQRISHGKGASMKPVVDASLCIGCGSCETECPEAFRLEDDGISHVIVDDAGPDLYGCIRDAADACPTEAISIVE